jgi:hypothetical protein
MKIALIGATGHVGAWILKELVARGHEVTAIARDPSKLAAQPNVTAAKADATVPAELAAALAGHDAVISAFNGGWGNPDIYERHLNGSKAIVEATKASGVKRLLVVGGAGSLEVAPGRQLVDSPEFPAEWKDGALAARDALAALRKETGLEWTFFSPAIFSEDGPRTGKYRLGGDQLLVDAKGESRVSWADFAVAMVDEAEKRAHVRERVAVAY